MSNWQIQVASSGSFVDLETGYGFRVQQSLGAGMASIQNISTNFGLLDGALFQRQRTDVRPFTLTGAINGTTVANLHAKRSAIIDEVKPDRSATQSPVLLRYTGGASTLQASCFYDGGLELGNVNNLSELNIALRFLMYDPYWEKTTSSSATLTVQSTFGASSIVQRAACGTWGSLGAGLNGAVLTITSNNAGTLFVGGAFTAVGGGGAEASRVAQWSGTAWSKVGNAMNDTVNALCFNTNGSLIAGGDFTTASGGAVAANRVALWSGTAWVTMGTGMNDRVNTLLSHSSGSVIAGGEFWTANGASVDFVARWSGTAWSEMLNGMSLDGGGEAVTALAESPTGNIIAAGFFNAAGEVAACAVAEWRGTSWGPLASGIGAAGALQNVIYSPAGTLFSGNSAEGDYSLVGWNGVAWKPVPGLIGDLHSSAVDPVDNNIYLGGTFSTMYGLTLPDGLVKLIKENTFTFADVNLPSSATIYALHAASTGVVTVGFDTAGTASAAGVTTISNGGTAATYPILTACAPTSVVSRLYQLVNYTTRESIFFNLALAPAEVVTLDLRPGQKTFTSNIRGNIINTILPGSNVSTWRLLPGANNVSFWLSGGSGAAKLTWTERFWSLDG